MSIFDVLAEGYDAWRQSPPGAWAEEREIASVHLAPETAPLFDDAERTGLRVGNQPVLFVQAWTRT